MNDNLKNIPRLTKLNLSGNNIGDKGIISFFENLSCITNLECLNLSYNNIGNDVFKERGDSAINKLIENISYIPKLSKLEIRKNLYLSRSSIEKIKKLKVSGLAIKV